MCLFDEPNWFKNFPILCSYGISVWLRPEVLGWRLAWNTVLVLVYVAVVLYCERDLLKGLVRRKK